MNFTKHLENIFSQINIEEVFPELDPKDKGDYYSLKCPACGESKAYNYRAKLVFCNRDNNCGTTTNLFDYYCERETLSTGEGLRSLAQLTGYMLPNMSPELLEKYAQKSAQDKLKNDFMTICKTGRNTHGGEVVEYLKKRGYSYEEIISMEIGMLPYKEEASKYLIGKGHDPEAVNNLLSLFSRSHPVVIPYKDKNGQIEGYVSRTIDKETEPKYLYSKGLLKGNYLFNYDRTKREQSLIIVEGILDCLTLRTKGIDYVVALGGSSLSDTQLSELLSNKKLKQIILSLDNDPAGAKGTKSIINKLRATDLDIFVVSPELYGEAKDPDELVRTKGIEAYRNAIRHAQDVVKYECMNIIESNDISNDTGIKKALDELLDLEVLYSSKKIKTAPSYIINFILEKLNIRIEDVAEELEHRLTQAKNKSAQERLSTATAKATELLKKGDIDKATELLQTGIKEAVLDRSDLEIKPYTLEEYFSELQNEPATIKTGYTNFDNKLAIPTGAVTIIAGRPSHGKTTLMFNLMLNMIKANPTKTFVFFSYEEGQKAITTKLIMNLSEHTFKPEDQNYIHYLNYQKNPANRGIDNIATAQETIRNYTKNNRLILLSESYEIDRLTAIIGNLSTKYDIGAVFIDYIQKIPVAKYDNMRERVLKVSEKLRESAQNINIPLIVGSQLNRDSAVGMPKIENLKEAGNIEEDANLVVAIHNYRTADKEENGETTDREKDKNGKKIKPESTDIDLFVLKNRNGRTSFSIPFVFNGRIYKLSEN